MTYGFIADLDFGPEGGLALFLVTVLLLPQSIASCEPRQQIEAGKKEENRAFLLSAFFHRVKQERPHSSHQFQAVKQARFPISYEFLIFILSGATQFPLLFLGPFSVRPLASVPLSHISFCLGAMKMFICFRLCLQILNFICYGYGFRLDKVYY